MPFLLTPLPYAKSALAPAISERTMEVHYEKHHRGYVEKLNALARGTPFDKLTLEETIAKAYRMPNGAALFNNAAQTWNHDFFWRSMKPQGGGRPLTVLAAQIDHDFGSYDDFEAAFVKKALDHFGSGYVWLVARGDELKITTTENAVNPMVLGAHALIACDLWEHAYYLDYQNGREAFVKAYLKSLANWQFAYERFVNRKKRLTVPAQIGERPGVTHH
jgi:superoxide dismutase, Fe-Mn family